MRIGDVYRTSVPDSSLDWALVKIDFDKLLSASLALDLSDVGETLLRKLICGM